MENHNLSLTPLETQVLECFINNLYAEPGFSDVDANDISKQTKIPTTSIRGVLSSLVKKGIIQLDENDSKYVIIYLNEQFWYLHPTWKNA
jgi:DNA-binding MarR family transcriptional regulator